MTHPAYAVAYLREVDLNEQVATYIQKIDATLAPFRGRFLVHGGAITPVEGVWDGSVVILQFPDVEAARAWYTSPGYQEILPLRVDNSQSIACIVEGVPEGYRAVHKLAS